MRVLSLFSGIGSHDLGLEWAGMTIVGQVEIDDYCQTILEKHWPKVKRWTDITTVPVAHLRRLKPRIITGGFPCQDISVAGKQKGIVEGERSALWWHMWRIIRDVRPRWVLVENVPALRTKGADGVLASLEGLGYTCWPLVVGAWAVGAPHRRNRVWIVAHSESLGRGERNRKPRNERKRRDQSTDSRLNVANTNSNRIWIQSGRRDGQNRKDPSFIIDADSMGNSNSQSGSTSEVEARCSMVATEQSSPQSGGSDKLGDTASKRCQRGNGREPHLTFPARPNCPQEGWEHPRAIESKVGGPADGTTRRLALKALGNANPPQVVALIGRAIMRAQAEMD